MYKPPYLQPYKGKTTRHTCPECGQKECFTLYLDGDTHQPIHPKVGICNRAVKCGYHYPPKQYFLDNPTAIGRDAINSVSYHQPHSVSYHQPHSLSNPSPSPNGEGPGVRSLPVGTLPFSYVERSASYKSNFIRFLCEFLTEEQMKHIGDNYALGATKNKEVIFWQIDTKGKVRTGKIMQYNPETGRRIKHESGAIDWVHNKLKKSGTLPEDFNLQQCFFGEHLLKIYPDATVCIVESEKSALISAAVLTDCIWLATGGLNNLTADKCEILRGRTVILYPDLNAYDKWSAKAQQMNALFPSSSQDVRFLSPYGESTRRGIEVGEGFRFSVSTMLEDIATPEAKAQGLDLADFLINQLKAPLSSGRGAGGEVIQPDPEPTIPPPAPARFSPELEAMIEANPAVLTLIDKLDLIEY